MRARRPALGESAAPGARQGRSHGQTLLSPGLLPSTDPHRYLVRLSYLQIYNEVISDLLKPERTNLVIRWAG